MNERVITIQLRGKLHEIAYTIANSPEAFLWWSRDLPHDEALTHAELHGIEAACLADLRKRRADWQTQLSNRA